jgi:hypothetical protein
MSDILLHLRSNKSKKNGGLAKCEKLTNDVIAVLICLKSGKTKYICNSVNSNEKSISVNELCGILPHIPLGKERFIIFFSGSGGMGKSSLASVMALQYQKLISDKVFYIAGTSIHADLSLSKNKSIKQLKGEDLSEIVVEEMFADSLVIFDDIDNWEFHKQAIKVLNKCYETGRKFGINLIYISHVASNASESKIYSEVDMYITNKATHNRMMYHHLTLSDGIISEIEEYLEEDVFVCYNKIFNCVYTDKKIYKL